MKRITVRFNDVEEAGLELFKRKFGIEEDSKAIKLAIEQSCTYLENVTNTFIPPGYTMVLLKKTKKGNPRRLIY